ncbi:MAG: amidohydrolase [Halobacteriales archaeon]|nr:amidohydrolase [Halobacteriales archaeon]
MTELRIAGGQVLRPDGAVERADVLVDRAAGEVLAIGPDVGGGDETLDAEGGLVAPGLVNAHTHVAMTLLRGYADDKPLEAWLREDVWPVEAELEPADVRAGTELGVLEMIRSGTTAFADMYFHMDQVADVVAESGVRGRLGYGMIMAGKADESAKEAELERGVGFATEHDGRAGGRVRTAVMPHSLYTVGADYLEAARDEARANGLPLHFHAAETATEVADVREQHGDTVIEAADALDLLGPETFVAHGVHVTDDEIDRLAATGTGVVHCPASNMKLASGMAPVQAMLDAGVTVGLGTDGAASNNDLDLFDEVRDAAMLGKLAAEDAEAVDAASAVGLATGGSAEAIGLDAGRLEPGAAADLIVLDLEAAHLTPAHDLGSHLAYAVSGSDVRHTVCDGEVLMRDREVLTLDESAVIERAGDRAAALVERAEA